MKFEWKRQGKILDRLENEATESAAKVKCGLNIQKKDGLSFTHLHLVFMMFILEITTREIRFDIKSEN